MARRMQQCGTSRCRRHPAVRSSGVYILSDNCKTWGRRGLRAQRAKIFENLPAQRAIREKI